MNLLKSTFFTLCILFLSGVSQKLNAQQFHGGLTAGLVGSQVAGDNYSGFKKAGIYAGGYVSLDISDRSGLQMELAYFQKGSRENPTEKNNYDSYIFRANYVELPLLYQFKSGKQRNIIFEAGPSIGFLIGFYEERDGLTLSDKEDYNKPANLSYQFNIGFRWFFSGHFGAAFRYNASLYNIRTENASYDVWRLWGYGQFHDALVMSVFYQIK